MHRLPVDGHQIPVTGQATAEGDNLRAELEPPDQVGELGVRRGLFD